MTCVKCNRERLTIHGLCNDCSNAVDGQIERNLEAAQTFTVAMKAAWNWDEETDVARAN